MPRKAANVARKIGKNVRKAGTKARQAATPVIKAAVREAANSIKRELRAQGLGLAQRGVSKLQNIFGNGDYRTNSLIKGGINNAPSFGSTSSTYRRREPIGTVVSSSVAGKFQLQKFTVNPGLSSTFPWLSGLAGNYESYRPNSILLEYVPTSGMSVASGNTALGSVTMAAQYNPYAMDPQDLQTIQGYPDAVTLAPYEHGLCGLECKPSKRQADTLLIRNANLGTSAVVASGADTLFDLCEFFIATEGTQDPSVKLGQLWITYDIVLTNPIVPLNNGQNAGVFLRSDLGVPAAPWDTFLNADGSDHLDTLYTQYHPSRTIPVQVPSTASLNHHHFEFNRGLPAASYILRLAIDFLSAFDTDPHTRSITIEGNQLVTVNDNFNLPDNATSGLSHTLLFERYITVGAQTPDSSLTFYFNVDEPGTLPDVVAYNLSLTPLPAGLGTHFLQPE